MRINKYVAQATGLSRRAADTAITEGRVAVNGQPTGVGTEVESNDVVMLDGKRLTAGVQPTTIMLNKPAGYVVSREGQGSKTIYDLLPAEYRRLKPIGRLDKNSSGLLLLTNDGNLANELTHPKHQKEKIYEVELDKPLTPGDKVRIEQGIPVEDYTSRFSIESRHKSHEVRNAALRDSNLVARDSAYVVRLTEGRNRQIRRTFAALGYDVKRLHRTHFGPYQLSDVASGSSRTV